MQQIWSEILNLDNIGINHNFFDVGGNSLLAIQMVNLIKERLRINIEPIHVMEYPNIMGLAGFISGYDEHMINQSYSELSNNKIRKQNFSKMQSRRR